MSINPNPITIRTFIVKDDSNVVEKSCYAVAYCADFTLQNIGRIIEECFDGPTKTQYLLAKEFHACITRCLDKSIADVQFVEDSKSLVIKFSTKYTFAQQAFCSTVSTLFTKDSYTISELELTLPWASFTKEHVQNFERMFFHAETILWRKQEKIEIEVDQQCQQEFAQATQQLQDWVSRFMEIKDINARVRMGKGLNAMVTSYMTKVPFITNSEQKESVHELTKKLRECSIIIASDKVTQKESEELAFAEKFQKCILQHMAGSAITAEIQTQEKCLIIHLDKNAVQKNEILTELLPISETKRSRALETGTLSIPFTSLYYEGCSQSASYMQFAGLLQLNLTLLDDEPSSTLEKDQITNSSAAQDLHRAQAPASLSDIDNLFDKRLEQSTNAMIDKLDRRFQELVITFNR